MINRLSTSPAAPGRGATGCLLGNILWRRTIARSLATSTCRSASQHPDDAPETITPWHAVLSLPMDLTMTGSLLTQPRDFARLDNTADAAFYASARFVHHADGAFRANLTQLYASLMKPGDAVLDLCSSWDSHLPPAPALRRGGPVT